MSVKTLDFEKPIVELEEEIAGKREALEQEDAPEKREAADREIEELEKKRDKLRKKIYKNLTPWEKIQIARHMHRPRTLDYVHLLFTDWIEVKGDRNFHDDHSVVCGLARLDGEPVAVIGQQKGKDTRENVARNFGMMHPEGYRKALRLMRLAERFQLPIVVFIDTPGAYPGIGAEERGQAEAIARNIMEMFTVKVPIIGTIIGEGASGGALGIGVVDVMLMQENSWYCVISPEGCASILWRDAGMAPRAAQALKLSAPDLMELGVIDEIVPEPLGGAHKDVEETAALLKKPLLKHLKKLKARETEKLLEDRFQKFRNMGVFQE